MERQIPQNEKLDAIGQALIETARTSETELDKIVSAPHLFSSVRAAIERERQTRQNEPSPRAKRPRFTFLNRKTASAAFAALTIVLAVTAGVLFSARQPETNARIAKADDRADVTKTQPAAKAILDPASGKTLPGESEPAYKPEKLVYHEADVKKDAVRTTVRTHARSRKPAQTVTQVPFYPLTYTGNADEMTADAHVVRADIPRASLYAMGVDLPVGGNTDTVKAELLISSDGVTQGIRIVE